MVQITYKNTHLINKSHRAALSKPEKPAAMAMTGIAQLASAAVTTASAAPPSLRAHARVS
jgi:hypothetical protein